MKNMYLEEIANIPLLSDEETNELLIKFKNGDIAARDKLVKHNLRLVSKIASYFRSSVYITMDDLINIGAINLIKALNKFDNSMGLKLSTYLYPSIYNGYCDYLRKQNLLSKDYSHDISLYKPVNGTNVEDAFTIEDTLADSSVDVYSEAIKNINFENLIKVMDILTPKEKLIIYLRYGFINNRIYTLNEVGQILGSSKQNIEQIEKRVVLKLRNSPLIANYYE